MFDTAAYVHVPVCEDAVKSEEHFNSFKSDPRFTTILEHTGIEYSHVFMSQIIKQYEEYINKINWDLVKQNDYLGSPHIIEYPELSDYISLTDYRFSPSTVAYTFKSLDILNHIKKSNLNNLSILEIGAGYGGQCKMLMDMSPVFDIKINSYHMVDLYWPNKLQQKYLEKLGYTKNLNFISYEDLLSSESEIPQFDYLISIYALAEFSKDVQQFYIDKINNFPYHYLVWNSPSIHEKLSASDIVQESPKTGPHNVVIKSKVNE